MSIGHVFWNDEENRVRAGWRVVAQLAAMFAIAGVVEVLLNPILGAVIPDRRNMSVVTAQVVTAVVQLMSQLAMVISVWVVGRYLDKRRFRDFGFRVDGTWWSDLGFGLLLGALLMAVVFLVEWAAGWVRVTGFLVTREGGLPFAPGILVPLIGYLAVGIAEELWSRGFLLSNLAEGFNSDELGPVVSIALATVVQGGLFALLHADNPNASLVSTFNIFLVAFLLALGYLLTGELAISIGLHTTWNFFQGNVFGFPVSGGGPSVGTFIGTEQAGPALWTGGAFGPEAGLVGIGALAVGSLLTLLWVRLRGGRVELEREIAEPPERSAPRGCPELEARPQVGHA